ncbi:MAG: hypothetical protein K2P21_05405, partial [Lachnospiraceae bacterium]|nr:hypothetical protein [Lachnospiraceae bacterium]
FFFAADEGIRDCVFTGILYIRVLLVGYSRTDTFHCGRSFVLRKKAQVRERDKRAARPVVRETIINAWRPPVKGWPSIKDRQ